MRLQGTSLGGAVEEFWTGIVRNTAIGCRPHRLHAATWKKWSGIVCSSPATLIRQARQKMDGYSAIYTLLYTCYTCSGFLSFSLTHARAVLWCLFMKSSVCRWQSGNELIYSVLRDGHILDAINLLSNFPPVLLAHGVISWHVIKKTAPESFIFNFSSSQDLSGDELWTGHVSTLWCQKCKREKCGNITAENKLLFIYFFCKLVMEK